MSSMKVRARDLLSISPNYMLETFPKTVTVIYDDHIEVESSTRKLVYSWYIWEFHRRYPNLSLVYDHHVDSVLNGQLLSSNTHIDLLGKISKELILTQNLVHPQQKEEILELIYYITNQLHNELPKITGSYVATLDILDIIELAQDPEILELKRNTQPIANSIADFYNKSRKIILESPKYSTNSLVQFIRMNILNMNQVNQCVLARGFPIEVTGAIFSTPIMSNYVTGMYKLYDYTTESRGASKHLFSAEEPLQESEYFARRLQLVGMVVEGISNKDCGSTNYLPWLVKPPIDTTGGRQIYPGDLRFMKGKYYLDEETGNLLEITGKEKHLYGKMIMLRSVIYCREPDPHKVCPVCFGTLHHNVSRFANIGHLCAATLTQQVTQTILSTKHVIGSASGIEITLGEDARRYFIFIQSTMSFHMKQNLRTDKIKLIVDRNTAIGLTDMVLLNNIEFINPKRISAISYVEIHEEMPNGSVVKTPIHIHQNNREGFFSYEFLKFVKEKGWDTDEHDNFVFSLDNWNFRNPVIRISDMEYSYSDHAKQIANLIESNVEERNIRAQPDKPAKVLQEFFDLVNSKLNVNLALLEVMVYASMTPSVDDYGLARNHPESGMNVSKLIITNRSLGPAYVYEDQYTTISNPRSFFQEDRPSSVLDVFITPKEVVEEYKRKRGR